MRVSVFVFDSPFLIGSFFFSLAFLSVARRTTLPHWPPIRWTRSIRSLSHWNSKQLFWLWFTAVSPVSFSPGEHQLHTGDDNIFYGLHGTLLHHGDWSSQRQFHSSRWVPMLLTDMVVTHLQRSSRHPVGHPIHVWIGIHQQQWHVLSWSVSVIGLLLPSFGSWSDDQCGLSIH